MNGGWTENEIRGAVTAYFDLLHHQTSGIPVNKSELYRSLSAKFGRSTKSFERKFQNISAILYELNLPYCDGLKPFHNYQRLLKLMVLDHLDRSPIPAQEPHEILFSKLKQLSKIKVTGKGSGRYGLAVEQALGIPQNSSKDADFMGIELKTKHGSSLQTLFSRIPNRYVGYADKTEFFNNHSSFDKKRDRQSLYTSFSAQPDTLGFQLVVQGHSVYVERSGISVIEYETERLEEALLSKHSQTAFISLSVRKVIDGAKQVEVISVEQVKYCKWPSVLRFLDLIRSGDIYLDFTLSQKGSSIKDHGFLWRIKPESIERLYLSTEEM